MAKTKSVFKITEYKFPYSDLKFPGQASDEVILFIDREAKAMLWLRLVVILTISLFLILLGSVLLEFVPAYWAELNLNMVYLIFSVLVLSLAAGIGWWTYWLWRQSIYLVTSRRLIKFISTTPWHRYSLSLGLDNIVDTGAYNKGLLSIFFKMGTMTARSSAGNRKDKYFYLDNINAHEDLAHYINKVLNVFNQDQSKLSNYRPFIPNLKGEKRKRFMEKFPHYWS